MSAESGTPDIPDIERMQREVADLAREEQQRSGGNPEGYPEVPAPDDQPTLEQEAEVAEATVEPLHDRADAPADDGERQWPPDLEKQVELGRITPGQAEIMMRGGEPAPPADASPTIDKAA